MNNKDYKKWSRLIKEAPQGSALMGGAIVDSIVNVKPKDYDIWYNHYKTPVKFNAPSNWAYLEAVGKNLEEIIAMYGLEEGQVDTEIVRIENYDVIIDGEILRVQLIGLSVDPVTRFKTFDHSLTLGSFNKSGLFIHRKVLDSLDKKTVTLLNKNKPEQSLLRAQNKVKKLDPTDYGSWKYEGWE